jgi:hypothetical protein
LYLTQFLPTELRFYGRVLKPVASVALVRKAANEIRITIFFSDSYRGKKLNELVVTSNKLTNNFAGLGYKLSRAGFGPRTASYFKLI